MIVYRILLLILNVILSFGAIVASIPAFWVCYKIGGLGLKPFVEILVSLSCWVITYCVILCIVVVVIEDTQDRLKELIKKSAN